MEPVLIPERIHTLRGRYLVALIGRDGPKGDDDDVLRPDDAFAFHPRLHPMVHHDDPVASAQREAIDRGKDAAEQTFATHIPVSIAISWFMFMSQWMKRARHKRAARAP